MCGSPALHLLVGRSFEVNGKTETEAGIWREKAGAAGRGEGRGWGWGGGGTD